jgi:hypothetical protein
VNTEHPAPLVLLMATVWPAQPWMSRKKTLTRGVLRWCCVCGEEGGGGKSTLAPRIPAIRPCVIAVVVAQLFLDRRARARPSPWAPASLRGTTQWTLVWCRGWWRTCSP